MLACIMIVLQVAAVIPSSALTANAEDRDDIVVLYTNDVHCGISDVIGYDGLALYKKEMEKMHDQVFLVDAGDAIQGDVIGAMTGGEDIVSLMNDVGYDVATLGNHEFDYSVDRLLELSPKLNCGYVCCNFVDQNDEPVFEPYRILNAGEKKIAFVGAVTPDTLTSSTPAFFKDIDGNYIYSFCQEEGKLYREIQQNADKARQEGADVVILLGHLGEEDETHHGWTAQEVVQNTDNIDAVIDAHSHTVTENLTVKNKDGKDVTITQTGTKLNNIGKMTISEDNTIKTELINNVPAPSSDMGISSDEWRSIPERDNRNVDAAVNDTVKSLLNKVAESFNTVIGHSNYDLIFRDPETGKRAVRLGETNLGDLCADFIKSACDADIAVLNGGNIRDMIPAGDITVETLFKVMPYMNQLASAKVTGQQIIDYLELGASSYPEESGSFVQVSGLSYEIDSRIESTVQIDENTNEFLGVTGEYRVKNVCLSDGSPIDPEEVYLLGSSDYLFLKGGDFGIFSHTYSDVVVQNSVDYMQFVIFVLDDLKGEIPEIYSNPKGQGRIKIIDTQKGYLIGDANDDGYVTIVDVTAIQRMLAQFPTVDFNEQAADINGNGLDIDDATAIQRYLAEFEDTYHIGEFVSDVPDMSPDEYELIVVPN